MLLMARFDFTALFALYYGLPQAKLIHQNS